MNSPHRLLLPFTTAATAATVTLLNYKHMDMDMLADEIGRKKDRKKIQEEKRMVNYKNAC